mmetsp:Transcript_33363/g.83169  ORF Transcript_33363/g.83169 Transcript_33363/m.83169 type:complete len:202 (-) Transcript_33363:3163-3768(-)
MMTTCSVRPTPVDSEANPPFAAARSARASAEAEEVRALFESVRGIPAPPPPPMEEVRREATALPSPTPDTHAHSHAKCASMSSRLEKNKSAPCSRPAPNGWSPEKDCGVVGGVHASGPPVGGVGGHEFPEGARGSSLSYSQVTTLLSLPERKKVFVEMLEAPAWPYHSSTSVRATALRRAEVASAYALKSSAWATCMCACR